MVNQLSGSMEAPMTIDMQSPLLQKDKNTNSNHNNNSNRKSALENLQNTGSKIGVGNNNPVFRSEVRSSLAGGRPDFDIDFD